MNFEDTCTIKDVTVRRETTQWIADQKGIG